MEDHTRTISKAVVQLDLLLFQLFWTHVHTWGTQYLLKMSSLHHLHSALVLTHLFLVPNLERVSNLVGEHDQLRRGGYLQGFHSRIQKLVFL